MAAVVLAVSAEAALPAATAAAVLAAAAASAEAVSVEVDGAAALVREMDALYQEGIEFGEERGKKEMVQSLFAMGIPLEKIAQAAKESVSCVRQWIAEGTTAVK